jgi:hypothetical protein
MTTSHAMFKPEKCSRYGITCYDDIILPVVSLQIVHIRNYLCNKQLLCIAQ